MESCLASVSLELAAGTKVVVLGFYYLHKANNNIHNNDIDITFQCQ